MRITFILPYAGLAGGTRVVAIYAERLKARGHEVTVISTPRKPVPWRRKFKSLLKGKGWPDTSDAGPSHMDGVDVEHWVIGRWRPVVDADVPDADVVVATWWETAEWVGALSPEKGAKAYFVQHHETHPGQPAERVAATYRMPFHHITISNWLVDLLTKTYGAAECSHVPNSVDTNQFYAAPRRRQRHPTVGLLFSNIGFKRCGRSLEIVDEAARRVPMLRLLTFGACDAPPGLPHYATFARSPRQDELRAIYAKCDVWLCGSSAEGFHLPPLEAMACRCPVVSTRVGGPADIIEEGYNGHLVDVDDREALVEKMVRVLEMNEASWRRMSEAAHATAIGYTWDDATDRLEQALCRAVERAAEGEIAGGVKQLVRA